MTKSNRFRVAFSFSGEKRLYVSQVANILAKRFGKTAILYDKFHEAEFARRDLGIYLPELYNKETDLIVVVLSSDYNEKQWTGLEWTAIHDLLSNGMDYKIMLCRFNFSTVSALYSTAGFIECDTKTPRQLALMILERIALNENIIKNSNLKPNNEISLKNVSNNLPRIRPFFGRKRELKIIEKVLKFETKTWGTIICNPGGVGKTSLAIVAAYNCSPRKFEHIIFVSAKGFEIDEDGERELTGFTLYRFNDMLSEIVREIGRLDILKVPETHRVKLVLEAFRSMRLLLILDNIESFTKDNRNQLFTFLKHLPETCKAILTSRDAIGPSSEIIFLENLDQKSSLLALSNLSHHNPYLSKCTKNERVALYNETGGNPLLLLWAAGQLGRSYCRSMNDALDMLRSCLPGNDPLEFIFGNISSDFADEEINILTLLTYFNIPANTDHLIKLSTLNIEIINKTLSILINRSIIVSNHDETTFTLLPIVSNFIKRKQTIKVQANGQYLIAYASELILANGSRKNSNFPVLEINWPIIAAAIPLFINGSNDNLQTICASLTFFLEFSGRWDERLKMNKEAINKALIENDFLNAGWRTYEDGWIYYLRNEIDLLSKSSEDSLLYFQNAKASPFEVSYAVRLKGLAYLLKNEYANAIIHFEDCLKLRQSISPQSIEVANSLNDIGRAFRFSNNFVKSEYYFSQALDVATIIGYEDGIATYTGNLADVALDQKQWEKAESRANTALILAERLGRQLIIASSLLYLARALMGQKKYQESLPYIHRSVEIYTSLSSPKTKDAKVILEVCENMLLKIQH